MAKTKDVLDRAKPFNELHVNQDPKRGIQGGIFLIQGREAFDFDGRPVAPGKIWLCQECEVAKGQMPFMCYIEIDFLKHMAEKHVTKETKKKTN